MERNKKVLISIIIATYNAEQHLMACLNSIVKQSNKDFFEVIVVDGMSSDQTIQILNDFKGLCLRWKSEADQGIYDALNKGIGMATGKWLYFLGSDDRLLPGFSTLADQLKDENTVYYGNSIGRSQDMDVQTYGLLQGEFSAYRLAKFCMNHQSILYPAKVFQKRKYDLKYKVLADYAFNIRLWGDRQFPKVFYPFKIVDYNMDGFSSMHIDQQFEQDKLRLIRKEMGWNVFLRFMFRRFKDRLKSR